MMIPKILPDELLAGYQSRVLALNGMEAFSDFTRKLSRVAGRTVSTPEALCSFIEASAEAACAAPYEFLRNHSCAAIVSLPRTPWPELTASTLGTNTATTLFMHTGTVSWRLCQTCVQQDLTEHQFAYWRRRHHVPGRFTCPIHGDLLMMVSSEDATGLTPDSLMNVVRPSDQEIAALERSNPGIQRTLAIIDRFLAHGLCVDRSYCLAEMQRRTEQLGGAIASGSWSSKTHKFIADSLTTAWLSTVVPPSRLNPRSTGQFVGRVLGSTTAQISLLELAATASVMYECVDQAICALAAGAQVPKNTTTYRRTRKTHLPLVACETIV